MNNLEIIREFLLREKEVWNKIKLSIYANLLDKEKESLKEAEINFLYHKSARYKDQIEEIKKIIQVLKNRLGSESNTPQKNIDYSSSVRKEIIESVFERISLMKNSKAYFLDSVRIQIFGELTNSLNRNLIEVNKSLMFHENHLISFQIGIGEKKPLEIPEDQKKQIEKGLDELIRNELIDSNEISAIRPQSIERLKQWYSIDTDDPNGTETLGQKIKERVFEDQKIVDEIEAKKQIYLGFIDDFSDEIKKDIWTNEWINNVIPDEPYEINL